MPRKVFTAGEVLTATDVNTNLMDQTIMTFDGTAARGSAFGTAASEGMYTHLSDTDTLQYYNGSAWVDRIPTPITPGLEFISTTAVGTAVSSVTISNCFNATYDNYRIMTQGITMSVTTQMRVQFTGSSSAYYGGGIQTLFSSGAVSSLWDNNISRFDRIGHTPELMTDVYSPFLTRGTKVSSSFFTNVAAGNYTGYILDSISNSGFTISLPTGTLTGGTINIYGYRRA